MTDKELLQQWLQPGALVPVTPDATRILLEALRARLAQPEPTLALWNFKHNRLAGLSDDRAEVVLIRQREWQGLTDEEIKEIVGPWGSLPVDGYTRKLFDQIEAKLKEKNA